MARLKNDWYICTIDKNTLKELSKRSDKPALIWFGSYFLLLALAGILVVLTWGTWWTIAPLMIYSALWGCAASGVHETCHKTPFRTVRFNEFVLWAFGWMAQMEPIAVRWGHLGHHSFTHFDEGDTELSEPNPVTWKLFFKIGSGLGGAYFYWKALLAQAFGHITSEMLDFIPSKNVKPAIRNARIMVGFYALFALWALIAQSWLPVLLTFAPRILGGPVTGLLHLTQHTCLQMNVRDHRLSTRSFIASPLTRYFYFNMNYHVEHHMFPMVPFYNLPRLHAAIKDQLPEPCDGLTGVFKEIIGGINRQRKAPSYFVQKVLPEHSNAATVP